MTRSEANKLKFGDRVSVLVDGVNKKFGIVILKYYSEIHIHWPNDEVVKTRTDKMADVFKEMTPTKAKRPGWRWIDFANAPNEVRDHVVFCNFDKIDTAIINGVTWEFVYE